MILFSEMNGLGTVNNGLYQSRAGEYPQQVIVYSKSIQMIFSRSMEHILDSYSLDPMATLITDSRITPPIRDIRDMAEDDDEQTIEYFFKTDDKMKSLLSSSWILYSVSRGNNKGLRWTCNIISLHTFLNNLRRIPDGTLDEVHSAAHKFILIGDDLRESPLASFCKSQYHVNSNGHLDVSPVRRGLSVVVSNGNDAVGSILGDVIDFRHSTIDVRYPMMQRFFMSNRLPTCSWQ